MTFPEKLEVTWHSPLESANEAHLVVAGGRVKARGKQKICLAGIGWYYAVLLRLGVIVQDRGNRGDGRPYMPWGRNL